MSTGIFFAANAVASSVSMTPWVAYTPTANGFGVINTVEVYSRQVGGSLQGRGRFTAGTVGATVGAISLGFNGINASLTIGSTNVIGANTTVVGYGAISAALSAGIFLQAVAGGTLLTLGLQNGSVGGLSNANANSMVNNGNSFGFVFEVPILGW